MVNKIFITRLSGKRKGTEKNGISTNDPRGVSVGKEHLNVVYKPQKPNKRTRECFMRVKFIGPVRDHSGQYLVKYLKYWTANGAI